MPYREGANLGLLGLAKKEGTWYGKLKLKNEMLYYGSMAGRRLGEEYGKM